MIDFSTQVLGFDFETQGAKDEYMLQPWRLRDKLAWISAVAYTKGDASVGALYPSIDTITGPLEAAADQDLYVCGWNVGFDCAWLIAMGREDLALRIKWLDAMLLWKHWHVEPEGEDIPRAKRKSYSLEAGVKEFFPEEAGFKDFKNFQTCDPEELKLLLYRCKEDTRLAVRLGELFWSKLNERQRQAALIEARCIPMVARANLEGIVSSKPLAKELKAKLKAEGDKAREDLFASSPEAQSVNLGSPKQLQKLLFEVWGLPVQGTSRKTGDPSTDKNALYELAFIDPRAKLLKQVREAKNNSTKYAEATIKSLDYNGGLVVRPQARVFGTYTSRMTYSSGQTAKEQVEKKSKEKGVYLAERNAVLPLGIALHQWKRGRDFRQLIRPPEGYTLCEFDAAGQEFRWMAVASGDETMLSLCASGEDAHSYMGAQVYGLDYRELMARVAREEEEAEFQRKLGKFCIAEGEMVWTSSGMKPIELVKLTDKVWDGVEWVTHDGVIYQGEKEVITYGGLAATEDHMVYVNGKEIPHGVTARTRVGMFCYKEAHSSGIRPVYDIANAGPRHRFTVSGRLVANCNLSYQYRVGAKKATMKARTEYEMDVDQVYIAQTQRIYKQTYLGVERYWEHQILNCKQLGYAETFAGRRVQLKRSWAGQDAWGMESTAINYPIQGTGGDQKYLAIAVLRNMLPKWGGYFYYELHDGIFVIIPTQHAQKAAHEIRTALSNLPYKQAWGITLPIKFPFDAKISAESWGHLKNLE